MFCNVSPFAYNIYPDKFSKNEENQKLHFLKVIGQHSVISGIINLGGMMGHSYDQTDKKLPV